MSAALIIKNGTVVTPEGQIKADIKIQDEVIVQISEGIEPVIGDDVIDAFGKLVLPGVIDAHVHYFMKTSSGGRTADDFKTGSLSAAFGGVTSFVDFASPVCGMSLLEALKEREREAEGNTYLDYSLHMEITGEFPQDFNQISALKDYGINSLKIYTTYGDTRLPEDKIPDLLKAAKEAGMLVIVHAEDDAIVLEHKERFKKEGKTAPCFHGDSRPSIAEKTAIDKIISMAKEVDCPLYIVHVSTAYGVSSIKAAAESGQPVYGETCPHYLLLTDDCYKASDGQKYIMTPPLRKSTDCNALWESISNGTLQCVVTDHCSFNIKDKLNSGNCFEAIPGIGGSETLLPLMYSEGVRKGRITLQRLVELLSTNPAKMFGLYPKKGVIKMASDGDLVIIDPEKEAVLDGTKLHSAAEYSVFDGMSVKGYPVCTISRGSVICKDNELIAGKPAGRFIGRSK